MLNKKEKQLVKEYAKKLISKRQLNEMNNFRVRDYIDSGLVTQFLNILDDIKGEFDRANVEDEIPKSALIGYLTKTVTSVINS